MCVLIGLQVCFHRAMKDKSDVSNVVGSVVRIYSFMKEIQVSIHASNIVVLFVKMENNNGIISVLAHTYLCMQFHIEVRVWVRASLHD